MAKDNTLGAPTEGLGQTVTFAAQGGNGTPQLTLPERGAVRIGTGGGNVTSTGQARQVQEARPDPTMAALMKMGGALLQPAIKREQEAMFMEGMQRAAQGEAVKEIVDEQPWYSKIFGPTNLVDGARAYSAAAKAASIATDLDARIEDISKMPGQEFARHINDVLNNAATGDDATDAIVKQQFMTQMPEVMKKQARSHYLYQQKQMIESNRAYVGTAFAALAASDAAKRNAADGTGEDGSIKVNTTDDGDTLVSAVRALNALETPAGMDPKVHKKSVASEVVQSINTGSFAVYNTLVDSQAIDTFEPEQIAQIHAAANAMRTRTRAELPVEFSKVIANATAIAGRAENTQEDVLAAVDQINKAYAKMTGDKKPYVTAQGATSLLQLLDREQQQELERAKAASAKASTKSEKDDANAALVLTTVGALKIGRPVNGVKSEVLRDAWAALAGTQPDAVNSARVLNYASNMDEDFADALRNNLTNAVRLGSSTTLNHVYTTQYLPLVKAAGSDIGEAPALKYAGEHADVISAFHRYMKRIPNPTQIDIDVAYAAAIQPKPKDPTKTEKEVAAELTTGRMMQMWDALGGDDIAIKDPLGAARMLTPYIVAGADIGPAVKAARATAKDTVNILGGYHWRRGTNQADINDYFNVKHDVPYSERNRAVAMGVDTVAKENGLDSVTSVIQVANTNDGKPQLVVMGIMSNGDPAFALLPATRIESEWANRDKTKAKEVPMPDARNAGKSALELANERFRKGPNKP
jgi:hypothetical protein